LKNFRAAEPAPHVNARLLWPSSIDEKPGALEGISRSYDRHLGAPRHEDPVQLGQAVTRIEVNGGE
jgi:hypothetical protein